MSGVPYGKGDCDPNAQWSRSLQSIGGVVQPVITPPTGVTVTTPSLAIGANSGMPGRVPAFSVNTIKSGVFSGS